MSSRIGASENPTLLAACTRGEELLERGDLEGALAAFNEALTLDPDLVLALNNRGNALKQLGRFEEALADLSKAASLDRNRAEVQFNLANVLLDLKRPDDALAMYDRVLAMKPDFAPALHNRGRVLLASRRFAEALPSLDALVRLQPSSATAHFLRGNALYEVDRLDEALAAYDGALALKPDYAEAYANRGNALGRLTRREEAFASYDAAFKLDPNLPYVEGNRFYMKMQLCDWSNFAAEREHLIASVEAGKSAAWPFLFLHVSDSPRAQKVCAETCAREWYPPSPNPLWRCERYNHNKIRVAYISGDFHDHPMPSLMAGVFEAHDRARFETIAIVLCPYTASAMQQRLKAGFDRFIVVHGQDEASIAELVRSLEIDIAVDLMGFTTLARTGVFARRPAPVQVNYLGFPGTMAAPYMDYIIADRVVVPENARADFSECIVRLPDTYYPFDDKLAIAGTVPSRAELGLPEDGFVFCAFNGLQKHNPEVFAIWMRLLKTVEGSVLWLIDGPAAAKRNLRNAAQAHDVAPERLVFAPRAKSAEHLARQGRADLFLDALPYNAHTTATDALWAGLPVLTCAGASFAGRVAASILGVIGLSELITHSLKKYEELALKLVREPATLAALRAKLARNRTTSPLFDTARYTRNLEAAYKTMWERSERGETPESFDVVAE